MFFLAMDESDDPNKPSGEPPTPEVAELLRILEAQTAARRQRHLPTPSVFGSGTFRYGALIVIVVFAFGALGLLEWLLSQMPRPAHGADGIPGAMAVRSAASGTTH
jgi:hypothetical protein